MWLSFSGKVMVSFYLNLQFYSDVGASWMFRLLYCSGCYGRVCFWLGSVNLVDSVDSAFDSGHSSLEGVKIENKLTGADINAKKCKNISPVTTKDFKIGQRGLSE